LPASLTRGKLS